MRLLVKVILRIVALFYTYGAIVHIMNIVGLSGFVWLDAPAKWQILDIFYLIIDVVVAVGLFVGWGIAFFAFYIAAISQIILYTAMQEWIIQVPKDFAVSQEQVAYLDMLVIFHLVTIVLVSFAWWWTRHRSSANDAGDVV